MNSVLEGITLLEDILSETQDDSSGLDIPPPSPLLQQAS